MNFWIGFWIIAMYLTQVKIFLSHNNKNSFQQHNIISLIEGNIIRVWDLIVQKVPIVNTEEIYIYILDSLKVFEQNKI